MIARIRAEKENERQAPEANMYYQERQICTKASPNVSRMTNPVVTMPRTKNFATPRIGLTIIKIAVNPV